MAFGLRSGWGFCKCRGGGEGTERYGEVKDRFGREWQPGEKLSRPGVLGVRAGVVDTFDVEHNLC